MGQGLSKLQNAFNWAHNRLVPPSKTKFQGQLIGHRGLYGHPTLIENTLPAFEYAIRHGAGLEYDLQLSKDGIPLIHHDQSLNRVFGLPNQPREEAWSITRTVCPAIPSLEQFLLRFYQSCPHHMVEFKPGDTEDRTLELIEKTHAQFEQLGLLHRVTFLSLDPNILRMIKEVCPNSPRAFVYLVSPKKGLEYLIEDPDCQLAGWFFRYPKKIPNRQQLGVGFLNHPRGFEWQARQNWKYIFTDRIDRLLP